MLDFGPNKQSDNLYSAIVRQSDDMTIIEQIMKAPQDIITTADSIERAIEVMLSRSLSTCPVTNTSGKLIGQLTDASLIHAVLLKSSGKKFEYVNDLKKLYLLPSTISKSASIGQLVNKVFKSPTQRVFIVDSTNKLLGLISPKDLLMFLINELNFKSDDSKKGTLDQQKIDFKNNILELKTQAAESELRIELLKDLFEESPNVFFAFNSKLKLSYANNAGRKVLGINSDTYKLSLDNVFFEHSSNQIEQFTKNTKPSNKSLFKQGYYSIKSMGRIEKRYEMSLCIRPLSKEKNISLTCIGRRLDMEQLLRKLNGVFNDN